MVRETASRAGGCGFGHTKDVKNGTESTLLGTQHYKGNTGSSSPQKYSITNIVNQTKNMKISE